MRHSDLFDEDIVYVRPTGTCYHPDPGCGNILAPAPVYRHDLPDELGKCGTCKEDAELTMWTIARIVPDPVAPGAYPARPVTKTKERLIEVLPESKAEHLMDA